MQRFTIRFFIVKKTIHDWTIFAKTSIKTDTLIRLEMRSMILYSGFVKNRTIIALTLVFHILDFTKKSLFRLIKLILFSL